MPILFWVLEVSDLIPLPCIVSRRQKVWYWCAGLLWLYLLQGLFFQNTEYDLTMTSWFHGLLQVNSHSPGIDGVSMFRAMDGPVPRETPILNKLFTSLLATPSQRFTEQLDSITVGVHNLRGREVRDQQSNLLPPSQNKYNFMIEHAN